MSSFGSQSTQHNALNQSFNHNSNTDILKILTQSIQSQQKHQIETQKLLLQLLNQQNEQYQHNDNLYKRQCNHLNKHGIALEQIRLKTAPNIQETLKANKIMHITKDFKTSQFPQNNLTTKSLISHTQQIQIKQSLSDQTLKTAMRKIQTSFTTLTQKIFTIAKHEINITHFWLPWEERGEFKCKLLQMEKEIEFVEYQRRIAKESIEAFRNYMFKAVQTIHSCIAHIDKLQKLVHDCRNDFQKRIAFIEQNPGKCSITYPQAQLCDMRNDLSTFEWKIRQSFIKFNIFTAKRINEMHKRKSKEFIKAKIIEETIGDTAYEWHTFTDIKNALNSILKSYEFDTNDNSEDMRDRILPQNIYAQYNKDMQIDELKANEANQKQNKIIYDTNINIITRMKICFVQKIWFSKSIQFPNMPIFNWKFLKTNQKSLKIKTQIIQKHGNKTDKIFLKKYNTSKAIHKPKKYWKTNNNWWYV